MSEEKKVQKFKLARNPDEVVSEEPLEKTPAQPAKPSPSLTLKQSDEVVPDELSEKIPAEPAKPAPSLTLKQPEVSKTYVSSDSDDIRVTSMLDDAYNPERKRAKRFGIIRSFLNFVAVIGLFLLSAGLIYAYAHISQQWPTLDPISWYLPFVLSIAISVAALIKSYQFMTGRNKRLTLMITGLCLAGGLTYWNVKVLHVTSETSHNALGAWQPSDMTEMLIAYEINTCRGIAPSTYMSANSQTYHQMFYAMPRDQWKAYFKKYLSAEEFNKINAYNIEKKVHKVATHMEATRGERWAEFEETYKDPPFQFRMKQWILAPYTFLLNRL